MPVKPATRADQASQRTVRDPVSCVGIGLHTGRHVSLTIRPAGPDTGVVFQRRDVVVGRGRVSALWSEVADTRLCTVLGNEHSVTVSTVEHLLAALRGTGVDNAEIEVDGPEVPIMDGSAAPFVAMIERAGTVVQAAKRRAVVVHRPVAVRDGDRRAELVPSAISRVSVEIDFPHPAVGRQSASATLGPDGFDRELACARTFGFAAELESLRARGLALGGSLRNAVIVDEAGVVNDDGLRFADEFARHKVLDCVGDLSLAGAHVLGHFRGYKTGHALNHALIRSLFADRSAWSYVRLDEIDVPWRRLLIGGARRARLARWLSTMVA